MGTEVYSRANRVASSYFRYQDDRKNAQPGAKPAYVSVSKELVLYALSFPCTHFGESKKESHGCQLLPVIASAHECGEGSPDKTQTREKHTGTDACEDHVGRNLKDEVRNEEDENDDGILR